VDVRSIRTTPPTMEHQGTTTVWWLYKPRDLYDDTVGGHLELIDVFGVDGGGAVHPHRHPTTEFYYVTSGYARMTIGSETREIGPGDLVLIPPDVMHSIEPVSENAGIQCFCFAFGVKGSAPYDYSYDRHSEVL
jgi:mannose-6-phosphate isomerase-like protein (cupin superfamily)